MCLRVFFRLKTVLFIVVFDLLLYLLLILLILIPTINDAAVDSASVAPELTLMYEC